MSRTTHISARGLGFAVAGLAGFGIWITSRATWTLAHGGNKAFDGTFDYPGWSALHFIPALVFASILPFQLWRTLRERYPRFHRLAGRVAAGCGLTFALTGLVLPFTMPVRPFGERLFMTTFGSLFLLLLCRGVAAARRGDYGTHREWMLRVTALSLGPLLERVIFPMFAAAGIDSLPRFWDLFVSAAWLSAAINLTVAEWWIRRSAASGRELVRYPLRNESALERVVQ